jgi:hypothetical protein
MVAAVLRLLAWILMGDPGTHDVVLVDGVGRPRILVLPEALVPANVIRWPHPQRAKGEAQVQVTFDRQATERDPDGRLVYRMRGSGTPPIRIEYLFKTPISSPGPKLRLEESEPDEPTKP